MNIETIDDIVEDIANKMGVYGSCTCRDNGNEKDLPYCCRSSFTASMKERIYNALENETKLKKAELI